MDLRRPGCKRGEGSIPAREMDGLGRAREGGGGLPAAFDGERRCGNRLGAALCSGFRPWREFAFGFRMSFIASLIDSSSLTRRRSRGSGAGDDGGGQVGFSSTWRGGRWKGERIAWARCTDYRAPGGRGTQLLPSRSDPSIRPTPARSPARHDRSEEILISQ